MYRRGRRGVTPPTLTTRSVPQEQPTMKTHKKKDTKLEGSFGSRLILSHFALSTVMVAFYRLVQRSIPTCHHRRESTSTSSDGAAGIGVHNSSPSTPNSVIAFPFCSVPVAGQEKTPSPLIWAFTPTPRPMECCGGNNSICLLAGPNEVGTIDKSRRLAVWYSQNYLNAANEADQR